jgi:hypothetical protein
MAGAKKNLPSVGGSLRAGEKVDALERGFVVRSDQDGCDFTRF